MIQLDEKEAEIKYEGNILFGAKIGLPTSEGVRFIDPALRRDKMGLYRLRVDSVARAKAKGSYPKITRDMDGQKRPRKKDIGADQFSSEPIALKPLTTNEVGPAWKR